LVRREGGETMQAKNAEGKEFDVLPESQYMQAVKRARRQGYPAYVDGDLICNICGEPWNAYGVRHDDMSVDERGKFLAGKGCPCE